MKKSCSVVGAVLFALVLLAPAARAQGNAKLGPEVAQRDPELEKDSKHNLEVAHESFKLKKAYAGALMRCEEIIAGDPGFSKFDEVLLIAGESSLYLSENKGKQRPSAYIAHDQSNNRRTLRPEEFRELAHDYLSRLVNDYPDSPYRQQAEEDLKPLGGPKPKESKQ
jgi:outer membrane protein assembly factor BamD (BamD/ComL family)